MPCFQAGFSSVLVKWPPRFIDRLILAQLPISAMQSRSGLLVATHSNIVMNVNPGTKEKNVMIIRKMIMPTATTHPWQADWHNPVDSCMR